MQCWFHTSELGPGSITYPSCSEGGWNLCPRLSTSRVVPIYPAHLANCAVRIAYWEKGRTLLFGRTYVPMPVNTGIIISPLPLFA